jgi:hypothetical protein
MAKVIGVHEIDLGEGADPAEFEQLTAAAAGEPLPSGMNVRVFKGNRGPRNGSYLMLIEINSVEERDRYFPVEDSPDDSPDLQAYFAANPAAAEAWGRVMNYEPSTETSTDYVELNG